MSPSSSSFQLLPFLPREQGQGSYVLVVFHCLHLLSFHVRHLMIHSACAHYFELRPACQFGIGPLRETGVIGEGGIACDQLGLAVSGGRSCRQRLWLAEVGWCRRVMRPLKGRTFVNIINWLCEQSETYLAASWPPSSCQGRRSRSRPPGRRRFCPNARFQSTEIPHRISLRLLH